MVGGVPGGEGACLAVEMETAADGMHPTGMHSCFIFTAHKRSLGQGNIFTPVCHSVNRRGVCSQGGGVPAPRGVGCLLLGGGCLVPGGVWSWVGVWSQGVSGRRPPPGRLLLRAVRIYWNVILNVQKALSQPILYFSTIF